MFPDIIAMIFLVVGAVGFWTSFVSFWSDGLKLGLTRSQCLVILVLSALAVLISSERLFRA